MAHIGFDRAQQCGLIGITASAHDSAECVRLDRVAENGAGAVRLDVIDGARIDSGIAVSPAQHVRLSVGVGREQSVGSAVVVYRAAGDHGEDFVAVTAGVLESLEDQHPRTLGTGITVGIGGERLDPPVRCQHAADFVEPEGDGRGHQCVHPTGQHHVGLAGPKCLHA